jgi:hypothetical protein
MEIAFEKVALGLEVTRGTLVTSPAYLLPWAGTLLGDSERYYPNEASGHLAEYTRSATIRRWGAWDVPAAALDPVHFMIVCAMTMNGSGMVPATPGGGTNSRLWTFTPVLALDNIKTASVYWGDPNIQWWSSNFVGIDEFTVSADTSGTDGATIALKGMGTFPATLAPIVVPSAIAGIPILVPQLMQLWLDTTLAMGTTAISDARVISAQFKLTNGVTRKWNAGTLPTDLSFTAMGRAKRHAELTLRLEVPDTNQWNLFANSSGDTIVKARLRLNGPIIEGSLRYYIEFDVYGPVTSPGWGELEGSNRTLELTILSHYDATLGADFSVKVQNTRTTL